MTIYQSTPQAVTCGIFLLSENINLTVTFVYAYNQVEDKLQLWNDLATLNATTPVANYPWAVLGDFNQILRAEHHSDHLSLNVDVTGMDDFNLAIEEANLFEAQSKGLPYIWWNNHDNNLLSKRIDHALINQHWATKFPDSFSEFLEPLESDHAPCLMHVPSLQRRVVKPFKIFHHIMDHPDYLDAVKNAWNCDQIQGTNQFKLARSLKLLKPVLRNLNKTRFSGITQRVKEQAAKVSDLQRQLLSQPSAATARLEHAEQNGTFSSKPRRSSTVRSQGFNGIILGTEILP
ncbi:hypothetical protein YC2023_052635 [Brassica napus]